jgi:capsular exopolysaccharide synthesis family protein
MNSTLGLEDHVDLSPTRTSVLNRQAGKHKIILHPDKNSRLVFLTEPEGLAVEQYKVLRHRLRILHPAGGVLLITSPSPGEGKTLTSVNLAFCLAEGDDRTCLVDLDLRAPGVSRTLVYSFGEDDVEDMLRGRSTIDESLRQIGDRPLYTIGVKKCRPSPGDLLSPTILGPVLSELRKKFHWIILDFAPVIPMADVAEVVPQVDGALLVVRANRTDKALIPACLETLGNKAWGVVMNDAEIKGGAYYGYYGKRRD